MNEQRDRAFVVAGGQLQGLVLDLVREIHGDAAVDRHARYDGDQFPEQAPTPLAGIWAADYLGRLARREVMWQVRRARESGHTWDEIGHAFELKPADDRAVAEVAYEQVAGPPASWSLQGPSFVWRCPACSRVISDRGPCENHPADNEVGHAHDCTRLAGEVERWRASCDAADDADAAPSPLTTPRRGVHRDPGNSNIVRGHGGSR